MVCKHWLRGLCKKGAACDFLHEYNLRKMPECNFFVRHAYCQNGDECLYLHIPPGSKLPPCPNYENGFCELGPDCSKRHQRKTLCKFFLAGFCPDGSNCKNAHPKWQESLPRPIRKREKTEAELQAERDAAAKADEARELAWQQNRKNWGAMNAKPLGNPAGSFAFKNTRRA